MFDLERIAALVAAHQGRPAPRKLALPPVGGTLRAFADGVILPAAGAEIGGERFVEWLARQPARLPRR